MSKKFNIREWVFSVKYWSLLFIPHIAICLIFLFYTLVGASIIQEIESDDSRSTSSLPSSTPSPIITPRNLDRERERLLSKIIDKRQTVDVQQYTKYIQKHIREYEEEIKNSYKSSESVPPPPPPQPTEESDRWSFSGSLFFIGTTLTTIGSNEFTPVTNIGKLFLMIYAAIGIPLTLVFLSDLSLLITRLIKYLSLILLRFYSTKSFLHIRQWVFFRFIEQQLNISIAIPSEEDDLYLTKLNSPNTSSFDHPLREFDHSTSRAPVGAFKSKSLSPQHHIRRIRKICNILVDTLQDINDNIDLTMPQLIITLFFYLLIGAGLISSTSYFDGIYICFTSLFSINLRNYYRHTTTSQEHSLRLLFFVAIYLLFGLAIVSLCVKAVQIRIQQSLENLGKKLLRDFVEFLRQMGFHELSTDDILASTELPAYPMSAPPFDGVLSRPQRLSRAASTSVADQPRPSLATLTARPIGVAEPLRRLSGSLIIRSLKTATAEGDTSTDKSVQVNTIIRSCGRCAGAGPSAGGSMLSVRKYGAISLSPSPTGDMSSGCEEDDVSSSLPPPNMDRLRQRRATLVAKTIINQMATQHLGSSTDEPMPSLSHLSNQRLRPTDSPPVSFKYSVKASISPPVEEPRKRGPSQEEFLEISKQISSLLTPSDDEN